MFIDLLVSIKNGTLRVDSRENNDKCKMKKVFYLGLKTKEKIVLFYIVNIRYEIKTYYRN